MNRRRSDTAADDPRTLAAVALAHIAADPERLADFMAVTGATPATLRQAAAGEGFHRAVLAYVLSEESVLVSLARGEGRDPAALAARLQAAVGPREEASG